MSVRGYILALGKLQANPEEPEGEIIAEEGLLGRSELGSGLAEQRNSGNYYS